MSTNKQEYNKRHNFKKDAPHSKQEISKISKIPVKVLEEVYKGPRKLNHDLDLLKKIPSLKGKNLSKI